MGFGFFGRHVERVSFNTKGTYTASAGTLRLFNIGLSQYAQINTNVALFILNYLSSNTGNAPDQQQLLNATIDTFNPADFRGRMITGSVSTSQGFKRASNSKGFRWLTQGNTELSPTRTIEFTAIRPDLIEIFSLQLSLTSTPNSDIDGVLNLPYLSNCKNYYFENQYLLTQLNKQWSPIVEYVYVNATPILNQIEKKFPRSLKGLQLSPGGVLTTVGANINTLLADCVNLIDCRLLFKQGVLQLNPLLFPAGTTLQLGHIPTLKTLYFMGSTVVNVIYDAGIVLDELICVNATNLNNATFQSLFNSVLNNAAQVYINVTGCNQAMAKTFVDADFKSTLEEFYAGGNRFTGSGLTLTTARPGITRFRMGNDAGGVTPSNKSNLPTLNVSGLTGALEIDLSNCLGTDLTLPNNSVCTILRIGGNKLDSVVQTTLFTEIAKLSGLTSIWFSTGGGTPLTGVNTGQDSTNGLGNNTDFTSFLPSGLLTLGAISCKLTGAITIQSGLVNLYIQDNNVTGISGSGNFNSLLDFQVSVNNNFNFNFTRLTSVTRFAIGTSSGSNTGQGNIDLSNRTSTADWSTLVVLNCSNVNTITFPTAQNRFRFVPGPSAAINIQNCTSLTSVPNIENCNWSQLVTSPRVVALQGNALNTDLKFGINNFLPTSITCQDNGMSQSNVDINIMNIVNNRFKWNTTTAAKSCNIGGTNSTPSGASVSAPTGYRTHAPLTVTSISKASPGVVTVSNIGTVANGDVIFFDDVVGMTQLNGNYYKVAGISGNTFQLQTTAGVNVDTTSFGTFVSGTCSTDGDIPNSSVKQSIYMMQNQVKYSWLFTIGINTTVTLGTLTDPISAGSTVVKTHTWFSTQSLPVTSTLKSFKVYCTAAGTLKIKVAQPIKGGSFNIIKDQTVTCAIGLNTFSVADGTMTEVVMPPHSLVGFFTPSSGGATVSLQAAETPNYTGGYMAASGDLSGNGVIIGATIAYAGQLQIQYSAEYSTTASPTNYIIDENFAGALLPAYAVNNATTPWVFTAGKATSAGTGLSSFLDFYPSTNGDRNTFAVEFEFKAAGDRFAIYRKPILGGGSVDEGTIIEADLDNNRIVVYQTWVGGTTYVLPSVRSNNTITNFTLTTGVRYELKLYKASKMMTATITNTTTSATQSFQTNNYPTNQCGLSFGRPGFAAISGQIDVRSAKFYADVTNPQILILGDSITEGLGAGENLGYAQLLINDRPGWFSGDGGTDSTAVLRKLRQELRLTRPHYVFIFCGVNNALSDAQATQYQTDIPNIYNTILLNGATPIIAKISLTNDANRNTRIPTLNTFLDGYIPTTTVKFNIATSVGGDGVTWNSSLFADSVHPNTAGHQALHDRCHTDRPDIF